MYGVTNPLLFGFINQGLGKGLLAILWIAAVATTPLPGDTFESQVEHVLSTEMMTRKELANFSQVFQDLQATLQTIWPGSQVIPLGSFVTGLVTKSSDADCMVKIPFGDPTSPTKLILEASQVLKRYPLLYDHVISKTNERRRIQLLKFTYLPTNRNCDVNFINNLGLQNSLMMGYYLNLHENFLSLAAILKLWSKIHRLRSTKTLASNTLNLLIIFYLQQEYLVPPFHMLQKQLLMCPVNDWMMSFETIPYNFTRTPSLYQLLGGFFIYYRRFNFDEYIVSPFLGYPITKRAFKCLDNLPDELFLYKIYMKKANSRPLAVDTKLCVQDAIEHRRNTAVGVSEDKANNFISNVRLAAEIFDVFPRNKVLKLLLNTESYKLLGY